MKLPFQSVADRMFWYCAFVCLLLIINKAMASLGVNFLGIFCFKAANTSSGEEIAAETALATSCLCSFLRTETVA